MHLFIYSVIPISDIDDCVDGGCENGGICSDKVDGFTCTCAPGYSGEQCQGQ